MLITTEAIVYLARKLHWTRDEIGALTPVQFNAILKELYYQESVDNYRQQYSVAAILAAIYNTIPRKRGSKVYQASDFLVGSEPERDSKVQGSIDKIAQERGVQLPTRELKRRQ